MFYNVLKNKVLYDKIHFYVDCIYVRTFNYIQLHSDNNSTLYLCTYSLFISLQFTNY